MKIAVVGAGSLGLLFAGKLSQIAGEDTLLVTHSAEQAALIRKTGISIVEDGSAIFCELDSMPVAELASLAFDYILLMTKQPHITETLVRSLRQWMGEHTRLICFQNGIGHIDRLVQSGIPPERIDIAVTTEAARKEAGNRVIHTGKGITSIGHPQSDGSGSEGESDRLQLLREVFHLSGLSLNRVANIEEMVWNKLIINSVINPLTAVLHIRNGQLPGSPFFVKLMKALFDEATAVMDRAGLSVSGSLWDDLLLVCGNTAQNHSSMLQDVIAGKETEIDWINGSLIRLASEHGVRLPTHEAVYHMVKGLTDGAHRF